MTTFHCRTWAKMSQLPQKWLNNHFTNVLIEKVIKTNFMKNFRAYGRIKKIW